MRHTLRKFHIRLMALAMAAMLLLCAVPAVSAAQTSGTCGDDLTWTLTGDTLTITGSGPMYDYTESTMSPWYEYRGQIAALRLPDGLTRVGDLAFYECTALKTVILPDSVTAVGWHAFDGCTALTMLDLGSSLRSIEDSAFMDCVSLPALRLPDTLTAIGFQAFYRCESLAEVTIPASVTNLGMTAFAFCYQLVRADILAQIEKLPDWTFYGCARLATVSLPATMTSANEYAFYDCVSLTQIIYTGSAANRAQIEADVQRDLEGTVSAPPVREEESGDSSSFQVEENEDGIVTSNATATETENASVSTEVTTTYPADGGEDNSEAQVTVTLESASGWTEVADTVAGTVNDADYSIINVYIKDDSTLSDEALSALAGKNATLTIHTAAGSVWKIDCTQLTAAGSGYDLSYERTDATQDQLTQMGCATGYQIRFLADAEVNAEVLIRLPAENGARTATLYMIRDGLTRVQSVVVDFDGYAHFYLGSVDARTTYLIGIDVPGETAGDAIIPDTMHDYYGMSSALSDVQYEITGRTSSWGMDITQVTWILAVVMVVVVITVGFIMFALNKRKLQKGYVPDLDEEFE